MVDVIVYGVGRGYTKRKRIIDSNRFHIVEFWDRNPDLIGSLIDGVRVCAPHIDFDAEKIIISSNLYFGEIFRYLTSELRIPSSKIAKYTWFEKEILKEKYLNAEEEGISEILDYLRDNELSFLNYYWTKDYPVSSIHVEYDAELGMFYYMYNSHRMYIKRHMDDLYMVEIPMAEELKAQTYVQTLIVEQDPRSPHYYWKNEDFNGKTFIDLGAAEGNFSLRVIDQCKKAIMVEYDQEWIEALNVTFRDYKDKVTIIPKFIGNTNDDQNITLDQLFKISGITPDDDIVIKMDIEGAEEEVLESAKNMMKSYSNVTILACTYHHSLGYENIKGILEDMGFHVSVSEGYLFFTVAADDSTVMYKDQINEVDLRKGLIYATKEM